MVRKLGPACLHVEAESDNSLRARNPIRRERRDAECVESTHTKRELGAALPPAKLSAVAHAFELGVHLCTQEKREADEPEPDEQNGHGCETAVK